MEALPTRLSSDSPITGYHAFASDEENRTGVTGQVSFDSHVVDLVSVAARLVNALTPRPAQLREAAAQALGGDGRPVPAVTARQAATLADAAGQMRGVFTSAAAGDLATAAGAVNALMAATGARPQLDPLPGGGWHVHFHGADDTLATGWIAGCATALALAMGSDLAGRLGVCAAERCQRVYVDLSRNSSKRFCSLACQNRTKAAAHRARR